MQQSPPGAPPVALRRDGHTTWIKWHRARRRADDPAFTATRIREGMSVGAHVEVDLVIHADRGFAVLHDRDIGAATTGRGQIADVRAQTLRNLFLRSNHGVPLDERVLLLEDLAGSLDDVPIHPDALLQLDFKEDAAALDPAAVRVFADAVAPFARHAILSCGDAAAVRILTDAAPGIRIGYDPCHHGAADRVLASRDYARFVDDAVTASPHAEMIYLEIRLIFGAAKQGFDLVGAFHERGRYVDAYTVHSIDGQSLSDVRRLLDLRVDQITTDDPEGLVAALGPARRSSSNARAQRARRVSRPASPPVD